MTAQTKLNKHSRYAIEILGDKKTESALGYTKVTKENPMSDEDFAILLRRRLELRDHLAACKTVADVMGFMPLSEDEIRSPDRHY